MVGLEDIEKSFRKFRSDFWEDVVDTNLSKSNAELERLKTKTLESSYFETVKKFAEERGWKIKAEEDTILHLQKEDKDMELKLVDVEEGAIFIQPWSRVIERLRVIEKLGKVEN